ncbi:MAG: hypothetical protein QM749_07130 [Aquabacterium sp.]
MGLSNALRSGLGFALLIPLHCGLVGVYREGSDAQDHPRQTRPRRAGLPDGRPHRLPTGRQDRRRRQPAPIS